EAGAAQPLWRGVAGALRTSTRAGAGRRGAIRRDSGSQCNSQGDPNNRRRQLHGFIPRSDAQHRVSKDGPACSLIGAPWSVLRDAARCAAPQDEGGLGITLAIWIRPQALEMARFAEERSLEFASLGFEFPSQ